MTEQEAREMDDLLTRTDPELLPNGTGFLSRREPGLMDMDSLSGNCIMANKKHEPDNGGALRGGAP